MAHRINSKIIIFMLAFTLCLSAVPAPAYADSPTLQEQVFKFYLDPALVPDVEFARAVLPKYVADINTVLSKNTNRRLLFDPETGIIITSIKPQTDSGPNPLPTAGFEMWAHAKYTDRTLSYGGYAGMDKSGAGVLAGLNWTRLYDPDNLAANEVTDYTLQLNNMLHELAHVFGAGIGEYYNIASITDTTSMQPLLDIRLSNPADEYWSGKPDFMVDPLLRFTRAASRGEFLAVVQYSSLTAAVINGPYRQGIPSFDQYTIQVLDENGAPLPDANVMVWNIRGYSPFASELLFDVVTDENGQATLPWGGMGSSHNAGNFLRLIKVYKDGVPIAQPRYVSIFDADAAMLVHGEDALTVTLQPQNAPEPVVDPTQTDTFTSTGSNDGWVLESAQNRDKGGSFNSTASAFLLGDNASNRQYRSVLSFNTASLPDNAIITGVVLMIKKSGAAGVNPFTTHNGIKVEIRRGNFTNNASLQIKDFQASPSLKGAGWFGNAQIEGWYRAELENPAYPFVNVTGNTQFRLQFALKSDQDNKADFVKFFSGNAGDLSKRPRLVIEYHLP